MERSEPTFVPEWLKNSGTLNTNTTSQHFQSSSLHSDEQQGVSKTTRNKSFVNINDPSISEKTTSSYFRRTSSNGSSHLRSYSSFGRNNRERDTTFTTRDKEKEKSDNINNHNHRHRDYSDPLSNILPSRFEKDGLRRSHSSVSSKRESSSWPKKVISDKNNHNNGRVIGNVKIAFERDFPSLVTEEKQIDGEIGRVPSPGLTTAIQSLTIGNAAVIGGDGWTSALAEVPVIVNGSNNNSVQSTSVSLTSGRNMAETLAHGPTRAQTAPQLSVGTQRLEELAVKQSRQLIPMTPSLPKALASNSSDKPKPKISQSQLQNSHLINHTTHSPRTISTKVDLSKPSTVGKLHVLKPSRERNGITPTPKDTLSPTSTAKLPNSPLAVPLLGPTPVPDRKSILLEKRPSSQAQSRNDFFNLMRKKSMSNNNTTVSGTPDTGSTVFGGTDKVGVTELAGGVHESDENKVDLGCNGDTKERSDNGKNDSILYSEEEEARFLRSLGWEDTTEEEEGLTEEEISSFYRDVSKYLNLQAASKIFKGTQTKLLMPLHSQMGKNGEISSDKLES